MRMDQEGDPFPFFTFHPQKTSVGVGRNTCLEFRGLETHYSCRAQFWSNYSPERDGGIFQN